MAHGILYTDVVNKPLSPLTSRVQLLPFSYYVFYVTGTSTPATVYVEGTATNPFVGNPTADANGTFPPIFLSPTVVYRVLMYDQYNRKIMDVDPYIPPIVPFGLGAISIHLGNGTVSFGMTAPGINGAALTLIAPPGGIALDTSLGGSSATPEIELGTVPNTGSLTPTFVANNKPGTAATGPTQWYPINIGGTVLYMPMWT